MFYREAGQYKTNYTDDQAVFPIRQDRIAIFVILAIAFVLIPVMGSDFMIKSIMIPFLIFSLAAIGLNILTGYAGQISLGSGAFMGVGAYACYKLTSIFPDVNILIHIMISGLFSAGIGVLFGLPSLRIKGFYLMVTTLAAQFFLESCWFTRIPWLYNENASGAIEVPQREMFGLILTGARTSTLTAYFVVLIIVIFMTWIASNLIRGRIGRSWMMIRDMDIAAELMGIRPLRAKLSAFAISSYYCGVAGALLVFFWLGAAEAESFDINVSFTILFMVILGGSGSLIGSFMGAAFIWVLPILLRAVLLNATLMNAAKDMLGVDITATTVEHINFMVIGALIIIFLIVEPNGLARLWQILKEKLRVWPFPYA